MVRKFVDFLTYTKTGSEIDKTDLYFSNKEDLRKRADMSIMGPLSSILILQNPLK